MPNYYSSYTVKSILTMRYKGAIVVGPLKYSYMDGITTSTSKTSVNTGSFVPGIYRVNPYSVSKQVQDLPFGQVTVTATDGSYDYEFIDYGHISGKVIQNSFGLFAPVDYSRLKRATLQRAAANVGKGAAQLGEDLFELKQTLRMLFDPMKAIRDFLAPPARMKTLNGLLSDIGRSGRNVPLNSANLWLQFRYGWSPLINTLQAVVEELMKNAQVAFRPDKIRTARSKGQLTTELGRVSGSQFGYQSISYTPHFTGSEEATCYARVQFVRNTPPSLQERLGLLPRFAPELAHELTKLSFVVDWLLQLGPWLGLMRFQPEIQVLGNTVGVKRNRKVRIDLDAQYLSLPSKKQSAVITSTQKVESYDRFVNMEVPQYPVFTGTDRLGINQTIDGISLILQSFLRNIRR